jgi:hypothetical protein
MTTTNVPAPRESDANIPLARVLPPATDALADVLNRPSRGTGVYLTSG